ncbi:hypothetical protein ABFT80_04485 [Mesorhizobium sp. SB112]|uniref:hypothetical protein n=1 Tax=Mesorhizobium sp. SB112 TaxID=3151853 RepID=UPI00326735D2
MTVLAGDNVLRLLSPLTLTDSEIDEGLARLEKVSPSLKLGGSAPAREVGEHVLNIIAAAAGSHPCAWERRAFRHASS